MHKEQSGVTRLVAIRFPYKGHFEKFIIMLETVYGYGLNINLW